MKVALNIFYIRRKRKQQQEKEVKYMKMKIYFRKIKRANQL